MSDHVFLIRILSGGERGNVRWHYETHRLATDQARRELDATEDMPSGQPRFVAGPAPDVGRFEQVHAEAFRPVGEHQGARWWFEQVENANRADDESHRIDHSLLKVARCEERLGAQHFGDRLRDVQIVIAKTGPKRNEDFGSGRFGTEKQTRDSPRESIGR